MPRLELDEKFEDGDRGTDSVFGIIRLFRRDEGATKFELEWDSDEKKWSVVVVDAK